MGIDLRGAKIKLKGFGNKVLGFVKKVGGVFAKRHISARSVLIWLAGLLVVIGLAFFLSSAYQRLSASWNEIVFAYQHPALVRSLREDYNEKLREMEKAMTTKEPTAEEKLLNEITNQLQELKD